MAKAIGTTDAVTTCDCCGKSNLKLTVAMQLDDGEVVHYGRTCAARNTGKTAPQINSEIKAEAARVLAAARAEYLASPEYIAERARFAARDEYARTHGVRMVGGVAMEFVKDACAAADVARAAIATKFGLNAYQVMA
ncbi:MAG: hypothetical protein V4451_16190 [Pseudomonadota bacterium]